MLEPRLADPDSRVFDQRVGKPVGYAGRWTRGMTGGAGNEGQPGHGHSQQLASQTQAQ